MGQYKWLFLAIIDYSARVLSMFNKIGRSCYRGEMVIEPVILE